jgi:hypothetical protein
LEAETNLSKNQNRSWEIHEQECEKQQQIACIFTSVQKGFQLRGGLG